MLLGHWISMLANSVVYWRWNLEISCVLLISFCPILWSSCQVELLNDSLDPMFMANFCFWFFNWPLLFSSLSISPKERRFSVHWKLCNVDIIRFKFSESFNTEDNGTMKAAHKDMESKFVGLHWFQSSEILATGKNQEFKQIRTD